MKHEEFKREELNLYTEMIRTRKGNFKNALLKIKIADDEYELYYWDALYSVHSRNCIDINKWAKGRTGCELDEESKKIAEEYDFYHITYCAESWNYGQDGRYVDLVVALKK